MEQDLRFVMPLLRILNAADGLRMNYRQLCSALSLSVKELQDTAMRTNSLEPLLKQDGSDLVLTRPLDLLDEKTVFEKTSLRGRFVLQDVITSTNIELMEEKENLVSGDVLVAEIQTAGRTRRNGKWESGLGAAVTMSLAFRFDSVKQLLGFSSAVGVACVTALELLGINGLSLKWPNDIMYKDGKLAGILIDTVPVKDGIFAVVGIGMNVHHFSAMDQVEDHKVVTLDDLKSPLSRNDVCAALINEVKYAVKDFRTKGLDCFLDAWHRYDALLGREITVAISEHRYVEGKAAGLNNLGELLLESNFGRTAIRSGHIVKVGIGRDGSV